LWFGNKYLDDFSSFFSSAAVGQWSVNTVDYTILSAFLLSETSG
jgi:hypothetical protein